MVELLYSEWIITRLSGEVCAVIGTGITESSPRAAPRPTAMEAKRRKEPCAMSTDTVNTDPTQYVFMQKACSAVDLRLSDT